MVLLFLPGADGRAQGDARPEVGQGLQAPGANHETKPGGESWKATPFCIKPIFCWLSFLAGSFIP